MSLTWFFSEMTLLALITQWSGNTHALCSAHSTRQERNLILKIKLCELEQGCVCLSEDCFNYSHNRLATAVLPYKA